MRNKLAKNSVAVGLVTLIVTAGLSFSAQGAPTFTSHAESQFISAGDPGLGAILDGLGEAIEGVDACEPDTGTCPTVDTQANNALLPIPADGLTGLSLGAANNYAEAGSTPGKSRAASGAVTDSGTINTGGGGAYPANAGLDLDSSALGGLTALADLDLTLNAVSSSAEIAAPGSPAVRDYNIAGGNLVLEIPALETLLGALEGAVGDSLGDIDNISLATVCGAVGGLPVISDICVALPASVNLSIQTPTLNSVLGNVSNLSANGVVVNLTNGTVAVDINALLDAANLDSLNDLAPNTDLLNYVLPAVVDNIDELTDDLVNGLIANILSNSTITLTMLGVDTVLSADQLALVVGPVTDALLLLLQAATPPLADALDDITEGLAALVQVLVNVPDVANNDLADPAGPAGTTAFVPDVANNDLVDPAGPAGTTASETAVRVLLAGGQLLDLRLATSVVGPNAQGPDDDGPADPAGDPVGPGGDPADPAGDPAVPGDDPADADAAADADVTTTLPATGSPNLLPFWMLGLGLLLFGATVLLNEKRRLQV